MIKPLANRSIQQIMLGATLVPALLMFLLLTPYSLYQRTQDAEQSLHRQGDLLAAQLASASEYALLSGNTDYLHALIRDLSQHSDVSAIAILDKHENTIAKVGEPTSQEGTVLYFEALVFRFIVPKKAFSMIEGIGSSADTALANSSEQAIGRVQVYLSRKGIAQQQQQIIIGGLFIALIALLISGWVGHRISRILLNPIQAIVAGVARIREGKYHPPIDVEPNSELGHLANNTNLLAQELEDAKKRVEHQVLALTQAREEADRANASKTEFLALLSHEIRSPLCSAYAGLQLLEQSQLNKLQRRYLSLAMQCSELMNRLTDDILDFSSIEAGKIGVTLQPYHLKELANFIRSSFEHQAKTKAIEFVVSYEKMPPLPTDWIETDPTRLQQIVINLVSNAIKFTDHGRVSVQVSISAGELGEPNYLQVSVDDTGIGIPTDKLQPIFEMFTQAQSPENRSYGGAGLGLCISQRLAERLGGTITVWSREGLGSTFLLELPVNAAIPIESKSPENTLLQIPSYCRILVVEDDALNQAVIIGLLKQVDIEADIASSGNEALTLFKNNRYDLVFIDCYMPEMNGFELARQIRQYESTTMLTQEATLTKWGTQRTPLVAITASALPETQEKCYAAGMDDFIAKPYRKFELYKRIAAIKSTGKILQQLQNKEEASAK